MTSPIPPSPPETPGLHYDYHPYNFPGTLLPPPPVQDGPDLRAHYIWMLTGMAVAAAAAMLTLAYPNPWAMFAVGTLTLPCLGAFALSQIALSRAQAAFETAEGQDDKEQL